MGMVEVINAFNQPAQKLIDSVSGAIGKVYEPHHMRKMADAEVYRINAISEAMRNNCDMPITYNSQDNTTSIDTSDFQDLVNRTGARIAFQEIKKQHNIECIIDKAYTELENETQVSEEPVSDDWMIRFFNSVEDISDENMQELFGKILAGEIKKPNSYSLRTLNVIRNLSQYEAELFTKISPLIFNGLIVYDEELLDKYEISYVDIIKLDDCGLISAKDSQKILTVNKNCVVLNTQEYIIIANSENESEFKLNMNVYVLTSAGNEIAKVINNNKSESLMRDIGKTIQRQNKKIKISLHKINEINSDNVSYTTTDLLEERETDE